MNPKKYDHLYIDLAKRVSLESKCPRVQVGCCILLSSGMIALGFNGMASGGANTWEDTGVPNLEVIHAEENCIGKLLEEGVSCKGATVYLTLSPCLNCAKILEMAKVSRVVFLENYRCTKGIDYLKKYNVEVEHYGKEPKQTLTGDWDGSDYYRYSAGESFRGGDRYSRQHFGNWETLHAHGGTSDVPIKPYTGV